MFLWKWLYVSMPFYKWGNNINVLEEDNSNMTPHLRRAILGIIDMSSVPSSILCFRTC